MIFHADLGKTPYKRTKQLRTLMNEGLIRLAGNRKLKIYGTLNCSSGKRMKIENRVFFKSEQEAKDKGYRPCGHCMREAYLDWKANLK